MMDKTLKFSLNPDFTVEKFDNEILLYAVTSSKGVYLNETAYLVWQMCGDNHSVGEIINILEETYPDHKETISNDVIIAIESLTGDENSPLLVVHG